MQIEHLVIDSSALIHNGPIQQTGKAIYSCPEIVDEIKDKATLERLRFLPFQLKLLQFNQDDLNFCVAFSKKTGDYKQLSAVDLKLIATVYRLEKQYNGDKHINTEPKEISIAPLLKPKFDADIARELDEAVRKFNDIAIQKPALIDDGRVSVACMTSDFSIQNCLLQMGLMVVSPVDGMMIKEAKRIALRCHACFKVFHDPAKIKGNFCPQCGNLDTLKRVQYFVDKNGEKKVLVNFRRPIKVKGNNQQIPKIRGGKHANNPVLTADQRVRRDLQNKFIVDERKKLTSEHILNDPAYLVRQNPFAMRSERGNTRSSRK